MSDHYCAFNHKEWAEAGLKDYGNFGDMVEYVNQEDDYCDSMRGEWYYPDDETMTVYYGSFGNDHSPGCDTYTYAEVFDNREEYAEWVSVWEEKDEYLESEEEEEEEESEDADDCDE